MGCFFACLCAKNGSSRPHLASSSSKSAAKQERSVSSNRLSSLFINEDQGDYPLNDKAKCGSSVPNTSIDKFYLNKQQNQAPTPIKLFEALERSSDSPENLPNSCISNAANIGSDAVTADEIVKIDIESSLGYGGNKSVTFECECECDASSYKYGDQSASKTSPNSTPLKLSDEMQTPGTVFPSNLEPKKEETFSSKEMSGEVKESSERQEEATLKLEAGVKQTTDVKESEDEGGLSSWLKPKQRNIDDRVRKIPHSSKTLVDRPIIGMVAAHWNEDESTRTSPKWWDGNGIPNSTNKYKEDQKVSWHATSFEERLEKALSDESLVFQGKHVNQTPMAFNETDESDTALSQLRPSPHSKSVVSF